MPIIYKTDILAALKEAGYNTNRIRKEKLLSEGVLQSLREKKYISMENLARVCALLNCQPGDLIEYVQENNCFPERFFLLQKRRKTACLRAVFVHETANTLSHTAGRYFGINRFQKPKQKRVWAIFPRNDRFISADGFCARAP